MPEKGTKEHCKIVCDTIIEEHDKEVLNEKINQSAEGFRSLQLSWTQWCDYIKNDFSWKTIWATPPKLLRFAIGSTYNTLPSPG